MFLFSAISHLTSYVGYHIRRRRVDVQFLGIPLLKTGALDCYIFLLPPFMKDGQGSCTDYVDDWVSQSFKLRGYVS